VMLLWICCLWSVVCWGVVVVLWWWGCGCVVVLWWCCGGVGKYGDSVFVV